MPVQTAALTEGVVTDAATVLELTGMTYRQLDHWCRQDYLRPLRESDGEGSGYYRQWTPEELAVARLMRRLVNVGFLPAAAAEYARALQPRLDDGHALLVLDHGITLEVS